MRIEHLPALRVMAADCMRSGVDLGNRQRIAVHAVVRKRRVGLRHVERRDFVHAEKETTHPRERLIQRLHLSMQRSSTWLGKLMLIA